MKTSALFLWNLFPERYSNIDINKRVICVNQGGTSSGKTYSILQVLFTLAITQPNQTITIVGQDIPNLKRGAIRDSQNIINSSDYIQSQITKYNSSDKIYYFKNNSIIEFASYENSQDAKNGKRDYLFINEANGIDYTIYSELELRTSKRIFIDYNPNFEFWVHTQVIPQNNTAYFISNFEHNPFISDSIVEGIKRLKDKDFQLWRVYGLGQTGKIEGLVFDYYLVEEMPKHLDKIAYGMDFGFTNDPTTLVKVGLSDGKLYGQEIIYQTGLTNRDIDKLLKENNIPKSFNIFADSADPKSIKELRLFGWNVLPADKGADSINYSIQLLKNYGSIHLTRDSINWIKEAKSYKWRELKDGSKTNQPIDAFNHCWDACRYYALGMLKGNNKKLLAFS
jgi:phage terminase large subunit